MIKMRFFKNKKRMWTLVVLLVAALAAVTLYIYMPVSEQKQLAAIARVKVRGCYAVPAGRGDTLFLSLRADSLQSAGSCTGSVMTAAEQSGAFVSGEGHVLTSDACFDGCPDSLAGQALRSRLLALDTLLAQRARREHGVLEGLDDYARTHSVVDDGYNEVMACRAETESRVGQADSVRRLLRRVLQADPSVARLRVEAEVAHPALRPDTLHPASLCARRGGLLLLQLRAACLPAGASRFSIYRWGVRRAGSRLFAHNDLGGPSAASAPEALPDSTHFLPATEGGVWVNPSGHVSGIRRLGQRVSSGEIVSLMRMVHSWPGWWWRNLLAWTKAGKPEGKAGAERAANVLPCARLVLPDSAVYEGQVRREAGSAPVRQGWGRLSLPDGSRYLGHWNADTLVRGERADSLGLYTGAFNRELEPEGEGTFLARDGEWYTGGWHAGRRAGHGFSIQAGRPVRCGHWQRGRFVGERMVYTAERVYGIDISRYQHGKGKKKYAIDWPSLRITGLGGGRRVQGAVDYPVSYIYIKATEGRTIVNRFYADDIRQARRHGLPAGSYHFFSPRSTGAQQAAHFLRRASIAASDLPPVLDLEPSEAQIAQMGGRAAMFREVLVWLRTVERRCGKKPVLYVGQLFVNEHLVHAPAALRHYDVWIARYGEFKPYVHLLHWQLTPFGRVRGIRGEVDINVFNGTKEDFARWLDRSRR